MAAPEGNEYWKLRESHGRKPIFEQPEDLWRACCEYFDWVEANPLLEEKAFAHQGIVTTAELRKIRAMTIDGLCLHLGISQETWFTWRKREDLSEVVARAERVIYVQKFEGAAAGLLNPSIIARDLGLRDSHEHSGPNGGPMANITKIELVAPEEATRIYQEFMG